MVEYQVIFTKQAEEELENIVRFLELNYPNRIKTDFLVKFSEKLLLLEQMPLIYPVSKHKPTLRRCITNKFTSLYYKVSYEKIFLVSIRDNRSDTENLNF